jgi:hypothetical protein
MNLWKVSAIDTKCKCVEKGKNVPEKCVTLEWCKQQHNIGKNEVSSVLTSGCNKQRKQNLALFRWG